MGYLYLALALLLSAYGNIVLKYHKSKGSVELLSKLDFVGFIPHFFFLTAWGWSCIGSILLCCLFWFAALSRFELSYVAPFLSLNFMLVMILSMIFCIKPLPGTRLSGWA